jgi:hypothetical protein
LSLIFLVTAANLERAFSKINIFKIIHVTEWKISG